MAAAEFLDVVESYLVDVVHSGVDGTAVQMSEKLAEWPWPDRETWEGRA